MAGVQGRSGRHKKIAKLQLRDLIDENWSLAERRAVIGRLHSLAMAGNVEAAKILLFMTYGRPRQQVELSGPEGRPLEVDVDAVERLKQKIANLARARLASSQESKRETEAIYGSDS